MLQIFLLQSKSMFGCIITRKKVKSYLMHQGSSPVQHQDFHALSQTVTRSCVFVTFVYFFALDSQYVLTSQQR